MSHATALIINAGTKEEVDEAMYPYWELDLKREDMFKDSRAEFNSEILVEDLEKRFQKFMKDPENKNFLSKEKISYSSAKDWVDSYHRYYLNREKTAYGYYSNPKAKWDWCSIGGRWAGFFLLKQEAVMSVENISNRELTQKSWCNENELITSNKTDVACMGDIDWEGMRQESFERACEAWKKIAALKRKIKSTDKKKSDMAKGDLYFRYGYEVDKNISKKDYIRNYCHPHTFAVLKNGEWFETKSLKRLGKRCLMN